MNVSDSQEVSNWWDNSYRSSTQPHYRDLSFADRMNAKRIYCALSEHDVMKWYNNDMRTDEYPFYHELSDKGRAEWRGIYHTLCMGRHSSLTTKDPSEHFANSRVSVRSQTYEVISIVAYMLLIAILLYKIISHIFNQ